MTFFSTDYTTTTLPAIDTSPYWNSDIGPYIDSTWGIDNVPNWGIGDWGIDFGGGGGTTGGNNDFWNQGLGGKLFDFGIAGLNTGMGISAMNEAQQAAQVQAERAAQATRKGNIWSAGCLLLSCYWVLGVCY